MPELSLAALIKSRGALKARLTKFVSMVDELNQENPNFDQLKMKFEKFKSLESEFDSVQKQIESHVEEDAVDEQVDYREEFENNFIAAAVRVNKILDAAKSETPNGNTHHSNISVTNPNFVQVALPTMSLPSFDGSWEQWLSFYQRFDLLIHSNASLSPIQKFQYLNSCVTGEASSVIKSLGITTENYPIAIALLKERYDDQRLIIKNHIRALFDLPNVTKDSPASLRQLIDKVDLHLKVLKTLDAPTETWDLLIIHLIELKLDAFTMREWETTNKKTMPTLKDMYAYLKDRCRVWEAIQFHKNPEKNRDVQSKSNPQQKSKAPFTRSSSNLATQQPSCKLCNQNHFMYQCKQFLNLSVSARIAEVKRLKLCFNCLRSTSHSASQCKSGVCKICNKMHNSLLHLTEPAAPVTTNAAEDTPIVANHHCHSYESQVLLSTAVILVRDNTGQYQSCRALIDVGSQSNFVTIETCKRLRVNSKETNIRVTGIGNANGSIVNKIASLQVKSFHNAFGANLNCLVVPIITHSVPAESINASLLQIPNNIKLADSQFHRSGPIDILIGAEIFWDLLCVGQIKATKVHPVFQKTHLGWIAGGAMRLPAKLPQNSVTNLHVVTSAVNPLDARIAKFWEIEETPVHKSLTSAERACETHFISTVKRDNDGRFTVRLPFKDNSKQLGSSYDIALKRLHGLERRLKRSPDLRVSYQLFLDEYQSLHHMSPVTIEDREMFSNDGYFLPHHSVVKESSVSTKLRVVFDASAKTSNGVSLNDKLMVGPVVQQDLFAIITRFRLHNIVISADITKMYRQIQLDKEDRKYQRILWRRDPSHPVQVYELNTVTYGMASSSYLATRCIQQVALEEGSNNPEAQRSIMQDTYVDDLLTGAKTVREARALRDNIVAILDRGCFPLNKWASNCPELLPTLSENEVMVNFDKHGDSKTLGLLWNCTHDALKYSICQIQSGNRVTKRRILSITAQIFDPLGLVGPVILIAKLMIQSLWSLNVGWDESVPIRILTTWDSFIASLPELNQLEIPRQVTSNQNPIGFELHGFCDASERAYGACIYIRSLNTATPHQTRLLCAKSRVAPLKTITLPRLELCGALLLSKLIASLRQSLNLPIAKTCCWTDSQIVLSWLAAEPATWKTFVANRVSEIQVLTKNCVWSYVNTKDNPADIISRGCSPRELIDSPLWWHGPSWLSNEAQHWPKYCQTNPNFANDQELPEQRRVVAVAITSEKMLPPDFLTRFSSLRKLQRVLSYCLRFAENCRKPITKHTGSLKVSELQRSMLIILKNVQYQAFSTEIKELEGGRQVSKKSRLISLNPFLDDSGLIRVGGRLRNSGAHSDVKHPIVLPKCEITELIVQSEHISLLHAGPQATLASLRQRYWPMSGRSVVRRIIHNCLKCFRANPTTSSQLMGDLPKDRVQPARPFLNSGVDFGGPVYLKEGRGRGKRTVKGYIALFVCFATKALHLELVGDLSSQSFLGALKRFISRRGHVANLYSDNGTNFVGARNELSELGEMLKSQKFERDVIDRLADRTVRWHFIPPHSPHHGGIWEAGIRSVKSHLKRVIGLTSLTYEEMHTVLTQIEACLNSRPLTPISNDPNDLIALSPSHFLIGDLLTAPVEHDVTPLPINRLSRWQYVEQLRQHFWKRWSVDYLTQLQPRRKWNQRLPNIEVGELAVIKEDNSPPLQWRLARVVRLHPGKDGCVRVVTLKTSKGEVTRSINKVCVLPMASMYS
jgi:hypothetical protein